MRNARRNSAPRWQRLVFTAIEVACFAAIPLLGYLGFKTLLDTRTGTFVAELVPTDPGWRAIVDPSPVVGVVEVDRGVVTGIAVIATPGETARGGAVMLFPGSLRVGESSLDQRPPDEAVEVLAESLRLRIPVIEIVDNERWAAVLGPKSYLVTNPDPVPGDQPGELLIEVGAVEVTGDRAAAFLGRVSDGADPLARVVRRELFWSEVLADPPDLSDDSLARLLATVGSGPHEVALAPYAGTGGPLLDPEAMEVMLRRLVPFPAGNAPGDRLKVRISDRSGEADLDAVAALVGAEGHEVVEYGNAPAFDEGPTQLHVPVDIDQQVPDADTHRQWRNDLADRFEAGTVVVETASGDTVTLVVGANFAP